MKKITCLILTGFIFWAFPAHATLKQIGFYKDANGQAAWDQDKAQLCLNCHVDKHPTPDAHEPNDYGKAVIAAAKAKGLDIPTADQYGKNGVGTFEDFAKKSAIK